MKLFFAILFVVGLCGWDSQRLNWTEVALCAAVTPKPDNLVNNQSWPAISGSALYPGAR